jgi:hypothetical protein
MAKSRALRKNRSGRRVVIRRLLDFLILAVVVWLAFTLAGRSLRQVAVAQIAQLTNAKIKAESIDFNFDGSVSIKKLVITPLLVPESGGPVQSPEYENAIFKAEKVYARFDIGSLLLVRPRIRKVTVNDFVFDAQYDLDADRWNTAGLKFNVTKKGAGKIPVVRLEKGTIQYGRISNGRLNVVTQIPLDAGFEPAQDSPAAYSFSITTAEMADEGKSTLKGSWQPGSITITGGISSANVPAVEKAWEIKAMAAKLSYDENSTYSLKLKVKDFLASRALRSDTLDFNGPPLLKNWAVFNTLQRFFKRYRPAGQIDIDLDASGNFKSLKESEFSGMVYCKDVSIRDVKFPYLVEHITGRVDLTQKRVSLNDLSGDHNDVNLTFNGWSKDFGPDWQYEIRIKSKNMALDDDLYNALSSKHKKFWSAFSPTGTAAVDYTLSRQSQTEKKRSLQVKLLDAVATYEKFPYPLKNLNGDLLFEADDITVSNLLSKYNGRKISLNGKVTERSTERPIYDLSVSAKDIPLDSELADALPAKQRNFYEQYNMTGLADAEVKIITPEPNEGPASFTADVSFKETSLKLEKLPLPVRDISAKAVVGPDLITLEDFTGQYDQSKISLTGRVWPTDRDQQSRYCLKAHVNQMELNDDLVKLLPASLKEIVSDMQLKGKINLDADLNKAGAGDCPPHKLIVECLGNTAGFPFAKDASTEGPVDSRPDAYPLKDVTGRLIITNDSIKMDDITASADDTRTENTPTIRLNGEITLADNAFGAGRLRLLTDDFSFDEQLRLALPKGLRDMYAKLSPAGRFDLKLEDVKMSGADQGRRDIDFAGTAKLKACNLDIWPAVADLDAVLDMNGLYNTGGGFIRNRVTALADSLRISGKSITSLKADLNYDPGRRRWRTENFIADCYGGKLTGDFEFTHPDDGPSEYLLQVGFNNIDLKQFLSDTNRRQMQTANSSNGTIDSPKTGKQSRPGDWTSGKMSGSLSLRADIDGSPSRLGRCRLIITDMKVGKPSPLAKLLYVLQLTEPKDFAFERMFVDSYIKNNRLVLEKFDLSGEALAFNGSGSMDLRTKDVNLTLTVRGKRLADAEPSVLQSLAENIGSGVVRMDVTGNAYDPDVKIKTLPLIDDSLKILGKKPASPD